MGAAIVRLFGRPLRPPQPLPLDTYVATEERLHSLIEQLSTRRDSLIATAQQYQKKKLKRSAATVLSQIDATTQHHATAVALHAKVTDYITMRKVAATTKDAVKIARTIRDEIDVMLRDMPLDDIEKVALDMDDVTKRLNEVQNELTGPVPLSEIYTDDIDARMLELEMSDDGAAKDVSARAPPPSRPPVATTHGVPARSQPRTDTERMAVALAQ